LFIQFYCNKIKQRFITEQENNIKNINREPIKFQPTVHKHL